MIGIETGTVCENQAPPIPKAKEETGINAVLNTSAFESSVYIGICGRLSFRENEREYAKLHIAHQIAMNRKCVIDYGYINMEGTPRDDRMIYDSNIAYDDTAIAAILERIVIVEEHRFSDFTVLAAKDSGAAGFSIYKTQRTSGERPKWVRSIPEINGYYTAVGIADRRSELYKSILVADVEAAQTIAKEKNAYIRGFTYDNTKRNAPNLITGNVLLAKAELFGFYILDRWIEPNGVCYSLAIARKE